MVEVFGIAIFNTCIFGLYEWLYLSRKNDAYLRKRNTFFAVTLGSVALLTWILALLYVQCSPLHRAIIVGLIPLCLVVNWSILHILVFRFPQVCIAAMLKIASINPLNRGKAKPTVKAVRRGIVVSCIYLDVIWILLAGGMFYFLWCIHNT